MQVFDFFSALNALLEHFSFLYWYMIPNIVKHCDWFLKFPNIVIKRFDWSLKFLSIVNIVVERCDWFFKIPKYSHKNPLSYATYATTHATTYAIYATVYATTLNFNRSYT